MPNGQTSIGDRIRSVREAAGISQEYLAKKLGVSPATVNRYEKGHRLPDFDFLDRLVRELGCDPGWLLSGETFEPPKLPEHVNTVGKRLKYFREETLGESKGEFVEGLGISSQGLDNFEADKEIPDGQFLTRLHSKYYEKLKRALNLDWLLTGKGAIYLKGVTAAEAGAVSEARVSYEKAYDSNFLREVIVGVEEFLKEEGKDLAPKDKAELITMLFTEARKMEAEGVEASSRAFRLSRLIARFVGSH